jgi:hypothetical protein
MKLGLKLAAVLAFASHLSSASTVKNFDVQPSNVAVAAAKSVEARGVITSSEDQGLSLYFAVGSTWGHLSIEAIPSGAQVTITSNQVQSAWGGSVKSPDKALLDGIAAELAGKRAKNDDKSRARAIYMEERRASIRSAPPEPPSGPATVLVHADRETVKSALISECASKAFTITGETEHQVTVSKDADAGFNLIGRLLFGNATVRAYRVNIQFILSKEAEDTRITAAAEILAQNGYGAIGRQVVTEDPQAKAVLQTVLDGAKALIEQSR